MQAELAFEHAQVYSEVNNLIIIFYLSEVVFGVHVCTGGRRNKQLYMQNTYRVSLAFDLMLQMTLTLALLNKLRCHGHF